jgi:hypothetical protein
MGRLCWRVRRDAGVEHASLRRLDHYYSQLCVAAVSACRRGVVIAIPRKGLWYTCLFHRCRSACASERLTVGNSCRS